MNQPKEIVPFDIKELTENNIVLMQTQCEEMIIDEKGKEKLLAFAQILYDMEWPEVKDDAMAQVVIKAKQTVWVAIEAIREGIK